MMGTKILVVEDEQIVALDIQARLARLGYSIVGLASSGKAAVRLAGKLAPDLVLMDVRLRGEMDGVEAAGEIRERFDIPVIYLTAYADDPTLQRAKVTGPFGYLLKPFEERELNSVIQMALHKHATDRELREQGRFLTLLNDITRAALTAPDLRAMTQTLAGRLGEVIGADGCYIAIWDEVVQRTIPMAAYGPARDQYGLIMPEPAEPTLTEAVLQLGRPLVVEDIRDSRYISARLAESLPDRTILGLPLVVGAQKLGAVLIAFHEPHTFTSEEIARGEQAARHVSLALDKARLLEREREQRLRAETLAEVTLALTSQTDRGTVLDEILRQARRITPHSTANIALLEGDVLRTVRWRGYGDHTPGWEVMVHGLVQPLARWRIDAEAIMTREPVIISDTQNESRWLDQEGMNWIRSYLAVPICLHDRAIGLLRLDGSHPSQFSRTDAQRLEPLANAAAIGIENARLFSEARQRADEMETLRHTGVQIASLLDLPTVLDTIAESALSLVGGTDCHIFLYDEASESFAFGAAVWEDGRREPAVKAPRKEGFTALVARERRTVVIDDARHHPLYTSPEAYKWNVEAIAGIPLKQGGRVTGVFTVAFLEPHTFSHDELRVLELLADQAVVAVENARLVERLEAEVAARTAEIVAEKETSEAILNSVGDAITMTDPQMRVRYVNPAFTALTGFMADDIIGERAFVTGAGERSAETGLAIRQAMAKREMWHGEVLGRRKDGRTYDASLTISTLRDTEGQLVGYVSSHRDVSRLKELDRARSRFIANVSHQLRTPVANVKLYAKLLSRASDPEKMAKYVEVLEGQADLLSHLIQDILEIGAMDSGQVVFDWEQVDLQAIVGKVVADFHIRARTANLTLEAVPAMSAGITVKGDAERLVQALGELVTNAVIFTPAGGRVEVAQETLETEGQRWATISVRDTGAGVLPEEQEQIFDRFYRGSLAESGHIFGSGLGLSIVDEIVKAHGGRVTVDSSGVPGQGSTFTLWLPTPLE